MVQIPNGEWTFLVIPFPSCEVHRLMGWKDVENLEAVDSGEECYRLRERGMWQQCKGQDNQYLGAGGRTTRRCLSVPLHRLRWLTAPFIPALCTHYFPSWKEPLGLGKGCAKVWQKGWSWNCSLADGKTLCFEMHCSDVTRNGIYGERGIQKLRSMNTHHVAHQIVLWLRRGGETWDQ